MINSKIVPINLLIPHLASMGAVRNPIDPCLNELFNRLRDDLWCYVEEPYVDRIYRDAYYHFFASKLDDYKRDCVRVAFFEQNIEPSLFFSAEGHQKLKDLFVGFIILRPVPNPNPGRTALSPRALKQNKFICELAPIPATIGGVKLSINAFPFSSQDGECMTCAETAIWTVMEYYGNKYPELKLVVPSEIHKAFQRPTRVLPSEGLTVAEIATALSNFGFGTYLYARQYASPAESFRRNLMYYIESGIPVILGLTGNNLGHAVVAIGHEQVPHQNLTVQIATMLSQTSAPAMIDTADLQRDLIFIDDNYPPYQSAAFDTPCSYYSDPKFSGCTIDHFIVPLNRRVYLDAGKSSKLISTVLEHSTLGWKLLSFLRDEPVIKRIFLTTGNSYKSAVMQSEMNYKLKVIINALNLPKFVWIAELSTPDIYFQNKVNGLILLDATGSYNLQSIKMLVYPGFIRTFDGKINTNYDFGFFDVFQNNLKGDWSQWKC